MQFGSFTDIPEELPLADSLPNDDLTGMLPVGSDQMPGNPPVADHANIGLDGDAERVIRDHHHSASPADGPPASTNPNVGRESRRFGTKVAAVNVLKCWFDEHHHNPYPSKDEKASLAAETGLTVGQVTTWFANSRRRRKNRGIDRAPTPVPSRGPIDISRPYDGPSSFMSPLERWRNSPPEAEAASFDAIMGAVFDSSHPPYHERNFRSSQQSTPSDARSSASSNASGSGISNKSASSACSRGSHSSNGSFSRFYSAESVARRRRRRKRAAVFPQGAEKEMPARRPYQCTFCTDTFRTKYDWTRHEKTLHLSLESYTCSPNGSLYTDTDGTSRCVFCDQPNPSESHVESHSYSRCREKPEVLRKFYRKDHLVQHLRLVHGIDQFLPSMNSWKSQVDRINSRCGLCGEKFVSWKERNEHIAQHFRDGARMKDWRGSRGLDPSVALATENSMPPYLIGEESLTLDPWSASRQADHINTADNMFIDPRLPASSNPSSFEYFTLQLANFVRNAQNFNETVTDSMIHTAGRHILYGDDDPWNQTPADNAEWLGMFKRGMGIETVADPADPQSPSQLGRCESLDLFQLFSAGLCSPWNIPNPDTSITDATVAEDANVVWSWQQPEALAEFREYYTHVLSTGNPEAQDDSLSSVFCEFKQYYNGIVMPGNIASQADSNLHVFPNQTTHPHSEGS